MDYNYSTFEYLNNKKYLCMTFTSFWVGMYIPRIYKLLYYKLTTSREFSFHGNQDVASCLQVKSGFPTMSVQSKCETRFNRPSNYIKIHILQFDGIICLYGC